MVTSTPPSARPGRKFNNKDGKNQYKDRPPRDDPHVAKLLKDYHLRGIMNCNEVSKLLLEEHGIILSGTSVVRRKRELKLFGSRVMTRTLTDDQKRQLVADQMAKDPKGKNGPRSIRMAIFQETGILITRQYIADMQRELDPVGAESRGPKHAKEQRRRRQERQGQEVPANHAGPSTAARTTQARTEPFFDNDPSFNEDDDGDDDDMGRCYPSDDEADHMNPPPSTNPTAPTRPLVPSISERPIQSIPTSSVRPSFHPIRPPNPPDPPESLKSLLAELDAVVPHLQSISKRLDSFQQAHGTTAFDLSSCLPSITNGMEATALLERQLARLGRRPP